MIIFTLDPPLYLSHYETITNAFVNNQSLMDSEYSLVLTQKVVSLPLLRLDNLSEEKRGKVLT